jgi:hypothetical protein
MLNAIVPAAAGGMQGDSAILNFAYYNFCLRHTTLRMTPAMAAGLTNEFWTVADLVECA